MATLESDERNIIETEPLNWRLIVYPLLVAFVVIVGGFGIYYYQLNQREQAEEQARDALATAKTPAEILKVVDQYPATNQAAVGLMRAAGLSFDQKDYVGALKAYQRVADSKDAPDDLRDSAQLGVASVQEASGKTDDAIQTYLKVAHKDSHSAFAPVAYHQAAAIYANRKDKEKQIQVLEQLRRLGGDSPFVKEAESELKTLLPAPVTPPASATNAAPASSTNAAPAAATNAAPASS